MARLLIILDADNWLILKMQSSFRASSQDSSGSSWADGPEGMSAVYTTFPDELDFLLEFKQDTKDLSRIYNREKRILMNNQATKMKENMTDYQAKKLEKLLFSLDQLKKREEEIR